jgi:putative protease
MPEKKLVGKVTHFFPKISVAVVELCDTLRIGDKIVLEKGDKQVEQIVESMQIEHQPIEEAKAGQSVGLKVVERVNEGFNVYKIEE